MLVITITMIPTLEPTTTLNTYAGPLNETICRDLAKRINNDKIAITDRMTFIASCEKTRDAE